jgi:hypothetical protein
MVQAAISKPRKKVRVSERQERRERCWREIL